jgi:hypothetical protein
MEREMTDQRTHELSPDPIDEVIDDMVHDVRKGARRASSAMHDAVVGGVDAIDDALHPTLTEQISELGITLRDNPSDALDVVRQIIRDRPILSATAIALAIFSLHRISSKFRAR